MPKAFLAPGSLRAFDRAVPLPELRRRAAGDGAVRASSVASIMVSFRHVFLTGHPAAEPAASDETSSRILFKFASFSE